MVGCQKTKLLVLLHKEIYTSVIDYAIAKADSFESINNFEIWYTDRIYSDGHNAIHLSLELPIDISSLVAGEYTNN